MSDIQRWHLYSPIMREESETGEWVTYADHVAAVAAEYERGVSDERARIRTAVDEMFLRLPFTEFQVGYCAGLRDVKTKAIDGEET